jgi:hypothetical protein
MKTVTVDQALAFGWCYDEKQIREIAGDKREWTALDVLRLNKIPAKDRVFAVCDERFIDAGILHEFGCWCAEDALASIGKPDPRSVAAIETKRRWLRGEATDEDLAAAMAAARAATWDAAWDAARDAARERYAAKLVGMLEDADKQNQIKEICEAVKKYDAL